MLLVSLKLHLLLNFKLQYFLIRLFLAFFIKKFNFFKLDCYLIQKLLNIFFILIF